MSSGPNGFSTPTKGRPIGNLSYDQSCNNSGHPTRPDLEELKRQPLHRPLYVAANTAEPQLLCVMSPGQRASAISRAMLMRRASTVVTWFSVNIVLPNNQKRYA